MRLAIIIVYGPQYCGTVHVYGDFAMGVPALYLQFLVDLTSANIKESM